MSVDTEISTYNTSLSERQKFIVLRENELHIWQITLSSDPSLLDICKSLLSREELKKIRWLKFEKDQNKNIISQGVLRLLLSDYLKVENSELILKRHRKGKPFIENNKSLFFNMSNSGNLCVYAFSRQGEVGIDIEEKKSLPDIDDLILKNMKGQEIDYINNHPDQKENSFFRFWTLKEAYLKAIGEGMRLTPDKLEFMIENENIRLINQHGLNDQEDWIMRVFYPKTYYFGALVYKNEKTKIKHITLI